MKNFLTRRRVLGVSIFSFGVAVLLVSTLGIPSVNAEGVFTPISAQVNIGETSANVTNLQTFLAADRTVYPEGIITGYYGPLTAAAVSRFQAKYGIDVVGRVGPLTLSKINSLIITGTWSGMSNLTAPQFLAMTNSVSSNSATITWTTNELATAKVFYHTSPITMNEGDINSVGFGSTNGSVAVNDNLARNTQQVVLTGLMPNTTYYYVVVATDSNGNVSVWNPNTTFRTNP
jgi:peptidoglycan hydrolase-like protein with peptidoglycan-binding domain